MPTAKVGIGVSILRWQLINHINFKCRQIFKDFKILTVPSLYILEVLYFINNNKKNLNNNCHFHKHNTGSKCDLHDQSCNTTQYKKV